MSTSFRVQPQRRKGGEKGRMFERNEHFVYIVLDDLTVKDVSIQREKGVDIIV